MNPINNVNITYPTHLMRNKSKNADAIAVIGLSTALIKARTRATNKPK
tara:strand:- start:5813 stop:5956 length:144 start_codon:yes stop_codon:yes gene_type:complete